MENIGIISTTVLALVAILGLVFSYAKALGDVKSRLSQLEIKVEPLKELGDIQSRLSQLEIKVEPLWLFVTKRIPDILMGSKSNPKPLTRRDELLLKYRDGNILPDERDELLSYLETEMEEARRQRDTALLIALGLLIVALVASSRGKI